jgi:uncharacterized protein
MMQLFVVECLDKPDSLELRLATRAAHLAYLDQLGAQTVRLGGPLLAGDGQSPIGSLLIFAGADRAPIEAIMAGDPYTQAGLFAQVTITPFRRVVGASLDPQ